MSTPSTDHRLIAVRTMNLNPSTPKRSPIPKREASSARPMPATQTRFHTESTHTLNNTTSILNPLGARAAGAASFDVGEYRKQQFLNSVRADAEALAFCVGRALWQDAQISIDAINYELTGRGFPKDGVWRTVAKITLVIKDGKSADFTFAAWETKKGRRYDFESDGILRNLNWAPDVKQVFQYLVADVMKQLR